jgi:hypothetical protein
MGNILSTQRVKYRAVSGPARARMSRIQDRRQVRHYRPNTPSKTVPLADQLHVQNATTVIPGALVYVRRDPSTWYYHEHMCTVVELLQWRRAKVRYPNGEVETVDLDLVVNSPWIMTQLPVWEGVMRVVRCFRPDAGGLETWVQLHGIDRHVRMSRLRHE